jgi:hypothetical protein
MDGGCLAWYTSVDLQPGYPTRFGVWAEKQATKGEDTFLEQGASFLQWALVNENRIREAAVDRLLAGASKTGEPDRHFQLLLSSANRRKQLRLFSLMFFPKRASSWWRYECTDELQGYRFIFDLDADGRLEGSANLRAVSLRDRIDDFLDRPIPTDVPSSPDSPWEQIMWTFMRRGYLNVDAELAALIEECICSAEASLMGGTDARRLYFTEQASILRGIREHRADWR